MDDELDEIEKSGMAADGYAVTYIWDIKDLENPKQTGLYKASVPSVDHNQYIKDGLSHQSSYMAGYRVYDISSIPEDPTGDSVCEIAYLDIYPDGKQEPELLTPECVSVCVWQMTNAWQMTALLAVVSPTCSAPGRITPSSTRASSSSTPLSAVPTSPR
jgi:hypothetical protein